MTHSLSIWDWYHILLNSNVNDLRNYCFVNQTVYSMCISVGFWKQKFQNDGIPLIRNAAHLDEWIREYNHVKTTINNVNLLIQNIRNGVYDENFIAISFSDLPNPAILYISEIDSQFINSVYSHY